MVKIATGDEWSEVMMAVAKDYSILNQCMDSPGYTDYIANEMQTNGCGSF